MSKLQPGMLALVIGSIHGISPHIGIVVTLVSRGHGIFGFEWVVDGCEDVDKFLYLEKHLLPLPPLADPLDQKQQQELHA